MDVRDVKPATRVFFRTGEQNARPDVFPCPTGMPPCGDLSDPAMNQSVLTPRRLTRNHVATRLNNTPLIVSTAGAEISEAA